MCVGDPCVKETDAATCCTCQNEDGKSPNGAACACGTLNTPVFCSANDYCNAENKLCSSHPIPSCANIGGIEHNPSSCACGTADCENDSTSGLYCSKKDNRCRKYSVCETGDGSDANSAACACGANDCEDVAELFCYSPRGLCSSSNKFSPSCVWSSGGGEGGLDKSLGNTNSGKLCIQKVQDEQPTANGVTWHTSSIGQCKAEFDMTGPTNEIVPSSGYQSCFLDSSIFSLIPVCDYTDGSAKHTSSEKCFCGAHIIGGSSSGVCNKNDYCYSPKSICTAVADPDWVADCTYKTNEDKNAQGCTCGVAVCEPAVNGPYCFQSDSRW